MTAVAVQLLGKTTLHGWHSCLLQLRLSFPLQADACSAGASCLAEGHAAAGQGCKAPRAAGMGMWPQTQSPLAVPPCCVKTLCCSWPRCHACAFIPLRVALPGPGGMAPVSPGVVQHPVPCLATPKAGVLVIPLSQWKDFHLLVIFQVFTLICNKRRQESRICYSSCYR